MQKSRTNEILVIFDIEEKEKMLSSRIELESQPCEG
jgi:hypothetical protein